MGQLYQCATVSRDIPLLCRPHFARLQEQLAEEARLRLTVGALSEGRFEVLSLCIQVYRRFGASSRS
jgi:hypothetical protein